MEGKIVCPVCGNEFVVKDLELLVRRVEEAWNLVETLVDVDDKTAEDIRRKNNIVNVKKEMKEKGFVSMLCQPCYAIMSWKTGRGFVIG